MAARAVLVALALALASAGGAPAQEAERATLTVTGLGEAAAVPDLARMSAGVETRGDSASDALSANAEAMTAVLGRIEAAGIAPADVATSGISVRPVLARPSPTRGDDGTAPRVDHFVAVNEVQVTVRDLDRLGGLVDALVASGANRIGSLSLGFSDPAALEAGARRAAVEDALSAAETYADAAGVTLGPILEIQDVGGRPAPVPGIAMRAMAEADAATPVARGERTVSAQVRIVWRIGSDGGPQ